MQETKSYLSRKLVLGKDGKWKRLRPSRPRASRPQQMTRHRERRREIQHSQKDALYYVGIDGEGITDDSGVHRYIMLQYSDKSRSHRNSIVRLGGITTEEALDFILAIPLGAKAFSYAFNYDLTKILADLDNESLYRLFRPELRGRIDPEDLRGPTKVQWRGYSLNLVGTKFTVVKGKRRRVIWDIFRFYQTAFVKTLRLWQVCEEEVIARIEAMKKERENFTSSMIPEMSAYCYDECAYLGDLAERLVKAHKDAGLELRAFYGAGSTAGALLKKMGVKDMRRNAGDKSEAMREPLACAFFGGRFENSIVGVANGPLFNYDICSAYPYQLRFLPCLDHGSWERTTSRAAISSARSALIRYSLGACEKGLSWGPLPFRDTGGSVIFPAESVGGWTWRDEYLAAESLFPNVGFREAWVYHCDCDCIPFRIIPEIYLQRMALGKDGAGIVLKLGPNSVYGKLAQSIGKPQYQCWIWAGMITSGTRAMLLQMLGLHKDWSDVLAFATDSIVTRIELTPPEPRDTLTSILLDGTPNKPSKRLGAWDKKVETRNTFLARPGIYFPLECSEKDLEHIRARGLGRRELLHSGSKMVEAWRRGQIEDIDLGMIRRFCGAKTCTHKPSMVRDEFWRSSDYGQWIDRPVCASLDPMPKRESEIDREGDLGRLRLRSFPGIESSPYRRALSLEALELKALQEQMTEQPEGMFEAQWDDEGELAPE
jgi:hypothetical protein